MSDEKKPTPGLVEAAERAAKYLQVHAAQLFGERELIEQIRAPLVQQIASDLRAALAECPTAPPPPSLVEAAKKVCSWAQNIALSETKEMLEFNRHQLMTVVTKLYTALMECGEWEEIKEATSEDSEIFDTEEKTLYYLRNLWPGAQVWRRTKS